MANNSKIVITAGLQVPETVHNIQNELDKQVAPNLKLEIACNINTSNLSQIQTQLNEMSKGLSINVNTSGIQQSINQATQNNAIKVQVSTEVDTKVINKDVDTIKKLFQLGLKGNTLTDFRQELKPLLQEFANAYKSLDTSAIEKSFEKILNFIEQTKNETFVLDEALKQAQTELRELLKFEGHVSIDMPTFGDLKSIFGSKASAENALNAVFGKGQWALSEIQNRMSHQGFDTIAERFKIEANNLAEGIAGLYDQLSRPVPKGNIFDVVESKTEMLDALAGSLKLPQGIYEFFGDDLWTTGKPMEGLKVEIQGVDSAMQTLTSDARQADVVIDELLSSVGSASVKYPSITKISTSEFTSNKEQLDFAKEQLNDYFTNIAKVEDSANRIKRAISDTDGELTRFYVQVEKGDKSIETLTYALNEQGNAYEYLGKVVREADNSTDFRRKGLDTQIEIQTQKVEQFAETVGKSQEATAILGNDIAKLREDIGKVGDTNAMNAFLDNFDIAKAKFGAISAQLQNTKRDYDSVNKSINENIKSLEKFNNSTVAKNNASNPTVVSQTGLNADLINQLRGLQESLANDRSPENVARITAKVNELDGSLRDAKFNSEALDQSLRDESSAAKLNANISKLTNQMDVFANTNRKATESLRLMRDGETTFAAKWQELTAAIRSGNLSAEDLKRLSDEFHVFRGEADAAGLTVSRFFQSMQSQLRMVLQRWISLYAVVGYIRKMIDNVKELDNAMINLRRVTDETDAGYQRFLEDANQLARQMKTTTSSLVEMSYQWSKLGYDINDALELAKSSTIFMRVADVGQDQALSNLVTSLKAFRLEASQTMDVVDKLDKLNNEYAVSAAGLGEGLERSASAMAMSGNTLEETLAMLTGAGEITQNLENTGNGIKILSLRLRGMKGALEELNEPVDDLMEVSKIQTQILNLTHNQVNIFDEATQEFRGTYDIIADISAIWDSLSSTSRANLTEILFGKQRANIGLALIQAFQSGQVQSAFEDATNAAGTATEEYGKMMQGIQAQFDAFKGAFQEFSNAFINSDMLKGLVKFGTQFINLLTTATDKVGGLVVVLTPLLMYFGGKTKTNIFSAIINGFKGLISAETGAITATGALTTAFKVLGGAISGLAIGAIIAGISYLADKLIVTAAETEESIREVTSAVGDLAKATEELEKSQADIENIAQSYSKIATTVGDVNERKSQLVELQNQLTDTYKDEANGIDLVNGKYSDQIKKLQELSDEQRKQYELENADKIARARRLANLRVDDIYKAQSSASINGYDRYAREDDKTGERALFTIRKLDERVAQLADGIDGVYASLQGSFDAKGIYLSGTIEDARNQLKQVIEDYSKLSNIDNETLEKLTQRYKELNDALNEIKEVTPYIENLENNGLLSGVMQNTADSFNKAVENITMQPFYDKLDEAQEKLKQIANPDNLTIAEYDVLYNEVKELSHELYAMAGNNEKNKKAVDDLFNAFKQGVAENGDGIDKFVEQFNTSLEESFKQVAETVTSVQDALSKLAEGKGLSHSEAWKLLKEDTDGYLQSIKLVNGEYVLSQEELIKFKDAKIQASIEELKSSNEQYVQERDNLLKQIELQKEELKLRKEKFELDALSGKFNSQSDYEYARKKVEEVEIAISETEDSIRRCGDLWHRNNLLIDELTQNLGAARGLSISVVTDLNNAVKQFEAEVEAIDNAIDSLNDRKEVLQDEKSILQDQLDVLNEQKKTIEDTIANYDKVGEAVNDLVQAQVEGIQSQIDALEEERKAIEDYYEEQLDALKEQNEERDDAIEKEEALANLADAQSKKKRVYSSARGWTYESSKEDILNAQNALAKIATNEQIKALEKERDSKLGEFDDRKKDYESQIKSYQEYAKQYTSIADDIKKAENELLADQILGSEWREKIEQKDEGLLTKYRAQYTSFNEQLTNLTNNEIATLQASIDAKDAEIKKVDDEVKAYNRYKSTVQKSLADAKDALETYKNNMNTAKQDIIDAWEGMEHEGWDRSWKMESYNNKIASSAESARDRIVSAYRDIENALSMFDRFQDSPTGFGIVNSAGDAELLRKLRNLGYYDNGGTNSYTGLAMLHGTKLKSETIFSANDSKKLYDMIHNTPNLMADMVKKASHSIGFTPVNNTNSNSVNVHIGQIVANNPREFTQGLDRELDSYFRRKLTASYVQ